MTIKETGRCQAAAGIDVRENEGGAPGGCHKDHHYGRRIEADRSWTVYHVFTGVPARACGGVMTGLSRSDATSSMMSLNRSNTERRNERVGLPSAARNAPQTLECRS